MYIHSHTLSDPQAPQATNITEDLKKYIAENGESQVETRIESERQRLSRALVIIGENHSAATRSADLARRLMNSDIYRYIASEFFYNSGPLRLEIRNFMRGHSNSLGRLLCQYLDLFQELRRKPKYMLFVGPRAESSDVRARRIAHHFMRELADRKLNKLTPGILVCGSNHGAHTPQEGQHRTTRLWLEEAGMKILSSTLVTDGLDRATQRRMDRVWPINETQSESNVLRLHDLLTSTSEYTIVPTKSSPFEFLTDIGNGFSGVSIAQRYEFVILAKHIQRCRD